MSWLQAYLFSPPIALLAGVPVPPQGPRGPAPGRARDAAASATQHLADLCAPPGEAGMSPGTIGGSIAHQMGEALHISWGKHCTSVLQGGAGTHGCDREQAFQG